MNFAMPSLLLPGDAPARRPRRISCGQSRAFSLIEVTLALAVFALAIVALLSLLPTAFNTAQRSRAETYATQIGRFVLSDLRAAPFAQARVATGPNPSDFIPVDLTASVTKDLVFDASGQPVGANVSYADGSAKGAYLVRLVSEAKPGTGASARQAEVTVSVESPAAAKATNRTKFVFTTIISR